jgi:transglutaminase-like putative cysteine protease
MEKYVHEQLSKKDFSTALASAAEVAESLQGDCTEHAVLLAAMLRAQKIPSRIAVGLVYADGLSAFGGHMWTEVLLGETWVPLDATLGRGGIGPAHIKLAESSFADDGPAPVTAFLPLLKILGQMQIEVVRAE